jgi:DNA-directed RNA polymerase specialized sigma24 family protein
VQKAVAVAAPRSIFDLVNALNREWEELRAQARAERPELDAQVGAAGRGDDTVLHELVAGTLAGDRLAARAVLQSQLGRLVRMASRDPGAAAVDEYVSAFWCVLLRYPLERRPVRIAANLALDTLKLVHRDRQWMGRSPARVHLAGDELEGLLDRHPGPPAEPDFKAAGLIRAGELLQLIDSPTGRLLHAVYVDGLSGQEAAVRCATTPGSLRVRCSRAVRRLAAHASELAAAA